LGNDIAHAVPADSNCESVFLESEALAYRAGSLVENPESFAPGAPSPTTVETEKTRIERFEAFLTDRTKKCGTVSFLGPAGRNGEKRAVSLLEGTFQQFFQRTGAFHGNLSASYKDFNVMLLVTT
jgi:hypothetical protein